MFMITAVYIYSPGDYLSGWSTYAGGAISRVGLCLIEVPLHPLIEAVGVKPVVPIFLLHTVNINQWMQQECLNVCDPEPCVCRWATFRDILQATVGKVAWQWLRWCRWCWWCACRSMLTVRCLFLWNGDPQFGSNQVHTVGICPWMPPGLFHCEAFCCATCNEHPDPLLVMSLAGFQRQKCFSVSPYINVPLQVNGACGKGSFEDHITQDLLWKQITWCSRCRYEYSDTLIHKFSSTLRVANIIVNKSYPLLSTVLPSSIDIDFVKGYYRTIASWRLMLFIQIIFPHLITIHSGKRGHHTYHPPSLSAIPKCLPKHGGWSPFQWFKWFSKCVFCHQGCRCIRCLSSCTAII